MSCANCQDCKFDSSLSNIPSDIHEIHITVQPTRKSPVTMQDFTEICKHLGVKPLLIDMQTDEHLMTSSTFRGSDVKAIREMWRIKDFFNDNLFNVVRTKIECSPTNPRVPSLNGKAESQYRDGYFESHLAVKVSKDWKLTVAHLCEIADVHVSRNAFKKTEDGSIIMVTHRDYETSVEQFTETVNEIKQGIVSLGLEVDKVIVEYAWYDSNVQMDDKWIKQPQVS